MRLLLTTDTVGGVWTFTESLASGLLARGHAVALVSFGGPPSAGQQAWCRAIEANHPERFCYHASDIGLEWMQDNARVYEEGAELLLSVVRSFAPELLVSSQYCYGRLPVSIPRIVVAHSDVLSWARACRGAELEGSAWLTHYTSLVEQGLGGAGAIIAPTQWMLNALAASFELPEHRYVVSNGLSIPPGSPDSSHELRAITAGRLWDEAKNLQLLQQVASPIPLVVAGPTGQTACAASPNVQLQHLGQLSRERLLEEFRKSAIYVCGSRYEPFGLAALEAALCGCAVLANDIPSLREAWGPGARYFDNAASLSRLLAWLHDSPLLLQESKQRSWQRASRYSVDRMVDGYLAVAHAAMRQESAPSYA